MEIKIGKTVSGVKITALETRKTIAGQNRRYAQFHCGCGAHYWTLLSVVAKAATGTSKRSHSLRCLDCQAKSEQANAKKRIAAAEEAPVVRDSRVPQVSAEIYRQLQRLPEIEKRIADRIIYAHVRACLLNDSPVENADRLFIEAMDIAKQEARCAPPVETRASEPFWRYDLYISPRTD